MKIGKLAKLTGFSVQTIRHYEKEGLLIPVSRSEGNFRLYDGMAISRLRFIKQCRLLGISLPEINFLLEMKQTPKAHCNDVNRMIDHHIKTVDEQIDNLQALRFQLKSLRNSCSDERTIEQCGILKGL